jgi:uncharacterized membrane protein
VSNLYRVLVVAHLLCVIGGFGTLAYNGLFLSLAKRRGPAGMAALDINRQVSGLAELLVYGTFLFGIGAVASSHSTWKFSQGWVSAAFALFIVDVGVLHGLIKRSQREYFALAERLATSSATDSGDAAVATRRAEAAQLTGIEKRISLGWGVFNLIVVVVVVLMVFRPGA